MAQQLCSNSICRAACSHDLSMALRHSRVAEYATVAAAIIDLVVSVPLVLQTLHGPVIFWHNYIRIDTLGAWVILCISIVYALSSIYAVGYMRILDEENRLPLFYALFSGFAFTMLAACVMNNVGVFWIAIELTTLISTFLVGFEREAESTEAAWKYIVVVSGGITLALLGTVLFYWGGSFVLGPALCDDMGRAPSSAPQVYQPLLLISFLLVLVGYGTKAGLAPMHTWLPDAHSESPAPVSAMLSGALLNASMLGIARFLGVVEWNIHQPVRAYRSGRVRDFLLCIGSALHREANRRQAIDGVFQRRTHRRASTRAGFWRGAGCCGSLLPHAESLHEQVLDVLRRWQCDARLWNKRNLGHPACAEDVSGKRNSLAAGCGGHCGSAAVRTFSQRIHHPACRNCRSLSLGRSSVRGVSDRRFHRFPRALRAMYFDEAPEQPVRQLPGWSGEPFPMWLAFLPILVLGLWWPHGLWDVFIEIIA